MYGYKTQELFKLTSTQDIWKLLENNRLEQMEKTEGKEEEEARRLRKIKAKLESGEELSQADMRFLKQHAPQLYAIALRVQIKRNMVKEECLHARSKSEVNDIYMMNVASVRKDDPAKTYLLAAIAKVMEEFRNSEQYKELPEVSKEEESRKSGSMAFKTGIQYEMELGSYQESYVEEMSIPFEMTM